MHGLGLDEVVVVQDDHHRAPTGLGDQLLISAVTSPSNDDGAGGPSSGTTRSAISDRTRSSAATT